MKDVRDVRLNPSSAPAAAPRRASSRRSSSTTAVFQNFPRSSFDTRNRARGDERRRARSTPRGSLEAHVRIRRAHMHVAITSSMSSPEDAATLPHTSNEPAAAAAVAS